MDFESLANELVLDIFEYLDTAHLFRAFAKLNLRFIQLLYQHCRIHQFNLQFLGKKDFESLLQPHLPILSEQIISLCLSNDETPDLPEFLLSRGFILNRFLRLQSLSLYNIHSLQTLNQIIDQCQSLLHFTHLNIIKQNKGRAHENVINLLNNIWSLSKLIYCNLNGIIHTNETSLSQISVTSSSIEHLFIENISCNSTDLSHLLEHTPNLQRLHTTLYSYLPKDHLTSSAIKMREIRFCFGGSLHALGNLLASFPHLTRLMLITSQVYVDGNMWRNLLMDYLPNLRIFQLKMDLNFQQRHEDIEEIIDELLESFRSSFWLEEHQWYIRCHWDPSDPYKSITLYTLPYAFNTYNFFDKPSSKSTCPDQRQYWSYHRVHTFIHRDIYNTVPDCVRLVHARFPHVRHLQIGLPLDEMFWSYFSSYNHLTSLHVTLYRQSAFHQLQILLDQSSCLYSLKIESYIGFSTGVSELTSKSIRRLDFIDTAASQSIYFNREDCLAFAKSSLGTQCEVLLISVKYRTSVLDLIEKMHHLRLLIIECEDDQESLYMYTFFSTRNELNQWLQEHLPSTYTITIDSTRHSRVHIWIDHEEIKPFSTDGETSTRKNNRLVQMLTSFRSHKIFS